MTEETTPVPAPNLGADIEQLRVEITNLRENNSNLGGSNEELKDRIESLQETLDNALEEISLRGRAPMAEPIEKKVPEVVTPPLDPLAKKEEPDKTVSIEAEIEKSIREESQHRTVQEQRIATLELREVVRDLDSELREAKVKYPDANESEILLTIEDMDDFSAEKVDIMKLAEDSHNRHMQEKTTLRSQLEEEYKVRLKKEGEGGISVPQSSGSSPTPAAPSAPGNARTGPISEDIEWGDALSKAKVEGRGV